MPVRKLEPHDWHVNLINGFDLAVHDVKDDKIILDPAVVLEKVGTKVEQYQSDPHLLEALPETLRAAGIALEEFVLV